MHYASRITHYASLILFLSLPILASSQSSQEIERLKRELEQRGITGDVTGIQEKGKTAIEKEGVFPSEVPRIDTMAILEAVRKREARPPRLDYFGYDFFRSRPGGISIWDNLPVPLDYSLGPGDEIIVSIWGETQLRSSHFISRDGTIFIDKVGQVNLTGKSINEAQKYLRSRFEEVYATLKNPNPRTFMDVSLGDLKSINVKFVGEVRSPGIYPVHPFSTVTTGLIQAGGVKRTGSLRDIQVIRRGEKFTTVDMYAFLLEGKTDGDIRLQDQDVVFVPVRNATVTVRGMVQRPAIYEALSEETFSDVLSYAGGVKAEAGTQLEVKRTIPMEQRLSDDTAVQSFYVNFHDVSGRPVKDGDRVVVHEVLPMAQEVAVYGQVKKPGVYAYEDSMRVLDLLNLAGGMDDESYWQSVYASRGEIIRRNEAGEYSDILPIDLERLRSGDDSQNLLLENLDQVVVRQSPYFDAPENVTILGEVKIPGVYSITRDNEPLESIIQRAGGFKDRVFEEGIEMYRRGQRVVLRDYSIPVAAGDSIVVPEHPGTVLVRGEVYNPGFIHFKEGKSLKDYVESAGGFTLDADKGNVSVIYANGDVKRRGWFLMTLDPRVREGATVVVHREEEREPFDTTEFLKEFASIAASLATIFFIISSQTTP
ncbi:MAG: SLBB domain-containing protein [Fidelibacterota bacterium]